MACPWISQFHRCILLASIKQSKRFYILFLLPLPLSFSNKEGFESELKNYSFHWSTFSNMFTAVTNYFCLFKIFVFEICMKPIYLTDLSRSLKLEQWWSSMQRVVWSPQLCAHVGHWLWWGGARPAAALVSDGKPVQGNGEVTCCPGDLPASCALWLLYFCCVMWGVWRHTRKSSRSCQLLVLVLSLIISCWCCCICNPDKSLRERWNGWGAQVQSLWLQQAY